MSKITSVTFWQPNLSHHMVPLMRQLTAYYRVTICVIERQSERRRSMGWEEPDVSGIAVEIIPSDNPELFFESHHSVSTVHIFSGTSGYPTIWRIFKKALKLKANLGFQAEIRNWQGIFGMLRFIQSRWEAIRIRAGVNFILAMGDRGVDWYKRVGYNEDSIFTWAYFTTQHNYPQLSHRRPNKVNVLYAGRFSSEKGIVPLIETVRSIPQSAIHLHIAGGGPQQNLIKELTGGQVEFTFHGMLPMASVTALLTEMDYLIVPSTGKDGWAAVVNEALSVGTPCIVSENAGASSLIIDKKLGFTYNPSRRNDLIEILNLISSKYLIIDQIQRAWIISHAAKISPQSGAAYLNAIIEHVFLGRARPDAPWKLSLQ